MKNKQIKTESPVVPEKTDKSEKSVAPEKTGKSVVREYTEAILIALFLALFIRTFVIQAFKIPSGSMLHTLLIGDHILVSKFIYGIRNPFTGSIFVPIKEPKQGDIVVFKYPENPDIDYIKRVIATAGDTIEVRDKKVFINGNPMDDPYGEFTESRILPASESPRDNFGPVTVPEEHIFVMGDNRDNSYDSRFWGFVNLNAVLGRAFILYWSWDVKKPLCSPARFTSIRWSRIGNILH
ncbi:MAG: signal peptidase I [Candidatus Electrothrix sp. YB6]